MDILTPDAADAANRTTDGDDTVNGTVAALSSENTLNSGDQIDGGAGNDTLNVDVKANFTGFSGAGYLKNVENVNLTNSSAIARTFDAKGITDVENYSINGQINLANLADTDAAISISNIADNANISLGFTADAVKGTADDLTIGLNGLGTAAVTGATPVAQKTVTVTANGIETLNVNTTGNNYVALVGDKATAINVAGNGTINTTVTTATKTFDASGNTGNVNVDLSNAVAGAVTSVATGAGDDVITADVNDLIANAVIAGGEGADRLELTGNGTTTQLQMSGVETISLGSATTALTGATVFSAAKASGINAINVQANFTAGATANFASMGAADLGFNLLGNNGSGAVTSDHAGTTTVNVVAGATATAAAPHTNGTTITAGNSSHVALNVGANTTYTGTVTAGKASALEVTGNVSSATLIAAAATSAVLNTTGTSALTLNAAKLASLNATVAAGTASKVGGLNLTASTLTGLESLVANIGANSTLTVGDLAKANAVDLSGAGTATIGKLGAASLGYGVNVNADGLKALTVGTIDTGAAQSVSVNAGTVLGAVTVGNITVGTGASTGSINVNVDGTAGTVSLGTLSAKVVTVDATSALGAVTYGAITVGDTLVVNGADLFANTVNATVTGTSINATLNGGIAVDSFTLTGASTTLNYVVSGDVEIGPNTVSIDATAQASNTKSVTINASGLKGDGVLTIKGGAGADTITASAMTDKIYVTSDGVAAAANADTILGFSVAQNDAIAFGTSGVAGTSTNYKEGSVAVADYAAAFAAAQTHLDATVLYSAQQVGSDLYVFYGTVANTATEVVKLAGVTLTDFDFGQIASA